MSRGAPLATALQVAAKPRLVEWKPPSSSPSIQSRSNIAVIWCLPNSRLVFHIPPPPPEIIFSKSFGTKPTK